MGLMEVARHQRQFSEESMWDWDESRHWDEEVSVFIFGGKSDEQENIWNPQGKHM